MMDPLQILSRIIRGGQPGAQPMDAPADSSGSYGAPNVSRPQPEDVFSSRVARPAGLPTDPMTPRRAFDQAIETSAPDAGQVLRQRIQRRPQAAAGAVAQQDSDLPMPPAPPNLRPVVASTPMPTREQHDTTHSGFGARLMDALYAGAQGLRYGLPGALGGIARGAVDPQFAHDLRYRKQEARYEQTAKPEREAIEAENRGKIQQSQRDQAYYGAVEGREKILDTRVNRQRQDEDRNTMAADRQTRLTGESADRIERERHNRATEGKGASPYRFHDVDQSTGETYVMSVDPTSGKAIRTDVGAQGRIQREPREGPTSSDRMLARQTAKDRVASDWSGPHVEQLINDYAKGLYSTYAKESGITWEDEQKAQGEGPAADEPNYTNIDKDSYDRLVMKETAEALTGASKHKTKASLIRATQARARRAAEDIVKRDLANLESKYTEEELGKATDDQPPPSGKRTGLLDVTSQRVRR